MPSCVTLPVLGPLCRADLAVEVGGLRIDLAHPSTVAIGAIAVAILVFVFRDPA